MKPTRFHLLLAVTLPLCACESLPERPGRPLTPPREEVSAKPGINAEFLAHDVDLARWLDTFEGESREIAASKQAIVASLDLRKGQDVADVGAGTGLFEKPLAEAVGVGGKVYALDISPAFVEHLNQRVR